MSCSLQGMLDLSAACKTCKINLLSAKTTRMSCLLQDLQGLANVCKEVSGSYPLHKLHRC